MQGHYARSMQGHYHAGKVEDKTEIRLAWLQGK